MHYLDFTFNQDLNPKAFKLIDNSSYDEKFVVRNGLIEVTPPGFSAPFIFHVNKNFTLILNANLLHINSSGSRTLPNLIDGEYKIKYSVDPNEKVFVEYVYFRNVLQERFYLKLLNDLRDRKYQLTNREYSKKQKELFVIKEYILGAKYRAEDMLEVETAKEMYNEINYLLQKFQTCHIEKK